MTLFRQLVAMVAVACLIPVGFPQQAQAMAAAESSEGFRQKVEQLGVGAEVLVKLRDQQQALRGTVESFDDSAFRLRSGGTVDQGTVRYADVSFLAFASRTYRAKGSPDPVAVRRVAVELGVGRRVRLKTLDGKKVVGRIITLDKEQLKLTAEWSWLTNGPYAYVQIRELKPDGMSVAGKVATYTAIGCGVAALTAIIWFVENYGS